MHAICFVCPGKDEILRRVSIAGIMGASSLTIPACRLLPYASRRGSSMQALARAPL